MSNRYIPDLKIPPSKQREAPRPNLRWIGKSMKRVEDPPLLTGKGQYVDDVVLPNMAHVALLRSPYAHARIKSIDTSRAKALPGVIVVVTGREFAEHTGPVLSFSPIVQHAIAIEKVRHVGEAVVAVVAEDRYIAEDALELIEVEYEELPVVSDPEQAFMARGDAVLHPEHGDTNVSMDRTFSFGPVAEDFAKAEIVVKRRLRWARSGAQPLETAGAVAEYDEGADKFTVHCNCTMHTSIARFCAFSLGVGTTQLNIVPPNSIGGSFGSKFILAKLIILTASLARIAGRPVKYIEDRLDNINNGDAHGSDRVYDAELALKRDGTMLSLRYQVIDDFGAYLCFGYITLGNAFSQVVGPYRINSIEARTIAVFSNKAQQSGYRGAGSEVSNFVIERMADAAARELGLDPVEIRRRNLIQPDEFPYIMPTGNVYDSGNYQAVLAKALAMFDYDAWRTKQRAARDEGRYIGIGLVTCQERSVFSMPEFWMLNPPEQPGGINASSSPESVTLRIDPSGKVFVKLNAPSCGNSPATVATQVVAEALCLEPSDIAITYADSDHGTFSTGPGGSRYTVMVSGALITGVKTLREKLFRFAAHMMECNTEDLELREGKVGVKGSPQSEKTIAEISMAAHYFRLSFPDDPEFTSGLETTAVYDHPLATMPAADRSHLGIFYPMVGHMVHAVALEVDPETGKVSFLDYVAVHDCGTLVNPMTMDGQIRGGTAQGIASALYEHFAYDESGQLLTASFADYHIPTVHELPSEIRIGHIETPSPYTEYGMKGGGEGGRMAAPGVVVQAVEDALKPFGVELFEIPLTPSRIRKAVREAQQAPI
jgi:CO/xanthine dehydrogenase Mo-binding subunit